jgi:signal transduction histidine kinase
MKTGSLRTRVILTTLTLLAIVLAGVVTAVTLAYRAKLDGDVHNRLAKAGAAVERVGAAGQAKRLLPGLALEGIAIRIKPPAGGDAPATGQGKTASTIHARGSLLILDEVLPDGTKVSFTASRASIDHAVANLLLVELLVAAAALALATLLVLQGTRTALRPLSAVIETAMRIAHGDSKLRLEPSRTDTELGSLAQAFDQMVDALEKAIDEARASDAATRRFLADASHELRTPIAALQASVETLLREQPERPERDRLEAAVARESERVGRLVGDLLGLARLEAHPTRTPIDLATIVRPLIEDAHTRAPGAAITLRVDKDTTVRGDPDALERVLRNLIDNALAAIQPTGVIEVRLRRCNGYVQARVADDGPGVPEHQRERIFERFVRLDSTKPGHGLGLAIARRIAEQHHGDLTCDPTPNGASFTLSLPKEA